MKTNLLYLLFMGSALAFERDSRVRTVFVEKDHIVKVQTSLGYASIISVPDKPSSLVLGDTEAFKVEYLDQAITIKPLHEDAQSNLYIYTDYQRFNVHLITGPITTVDYVVYLKSKNESLRSNPVKWISFGKSVQGGDLILSVERLARKADGSLVMACILSSRKKKKIDPLWFHIVQDRRTLPIDQVYLSSQDVDKSRPVQIVLQIPSKSLNPKKPLRVLLNRKPILAVDIPMEVIFK